ncbi:MAG: uridylate kinase [Planctomycetaceae bacterium]
MSGQLESRDQRGVVCKLGGSLLDWPGLPRLLDHLLERAGDTGLVLVVGGGATADLVRQWDTLFGLGEERAHWLALESLELNERLVTHLRPVFRPVRSGPQVTAARQEGVPAVLCSSCFVRWGERQPTAPPLPHAWRVTTDSIAAWAAHLLGGSDLVLLKSVNLPAGSSWTDAARAGLVDDHFPEAVAGLPRVSWVNARVEPWPAIKASGPVQA